MKQIDAYLELGEFVDILRAGVAAIYGPEFQVNAIYIKSYDRVRIAIDASDKVDCDAFCHRVKE